MISKLIKTFLTTILIGYVGYYIYNHFDYEQLKKVTFDYLYLAVSIIILILQIFIQSIIWSKIINDMNNDIKILDNSRIWLLSQYGKYLPGKIATFGIMFYLYKNYDISKKEIVIASYYELLCSVLSVVYLTYLALLVFNQNVLSDNQYVVLLVFGILTTITLHPKIINYIFGIALKLLKNNNKEIIIELSFSKITKYVLFYLANNILLGLGFYLFINSIIYVHFAKLPFIILSINLSGLLGMLAIFAPAGIGARESSIIYLLNNIMNVTFSSIISIVSRLWFVVGELLTLLIVYSYNLIFNKFNVVEYIKNINFDDQ